MKNEILLKEQKIKITIAKNLRKPNSAQTRRLTQIRPRNRSKELLIGEYEISQEISCTRKR